MPQTDSPTPSLMFDVTGMTCGACAARVERTLNRLDGVAATVNFATGKAITEFEAGLWQPERADELGARIETVIEAVTRAGYGAALTGHPQAGAGAAPNDLIPANEPDPGRAERRALWQRLVLVLVLGIPLADLSLAVALSTQARFPGWQWVLVLLAFPVATWGAWPFHRGALLAARQRTTTMDTLISLGVLAACALSAYTIFADPRHGLSEESGWRLLLHSGGAVYLDVVAGVTTFVLIGRLLEAQARRRTGGALRALASAGARDACRLDAEGREHRVPVSQLSVGDRFVVRPGEVVATDGDVETGHAAIDLSTMTGESVPVERGAGDGVVGGTVALDGRLVVRVTRVGADTQLAQLVDLVERGQAQKASAQRLADRVSGVFVPVVLILALVTGLAWWLATGSPAAAFSPALAVLVVACPCALGLATPMALLAAADRAAQEGIFIKSQQALDAVHTIDTVVLDKTGTVTEGRMSVIATWTPDPADRLEAAGTTAPEAALRLAGAVEDASEHPIALAVAAHAQDRHGRLPAAENFRSLAGLGAQADVEGHRILVGSARLMTRHGVDVSGDLSGWLQRQESAAHPSVVVAVDGTAALALALADAVKPSAAPAVARLHALGLRTVLLTGDNRTTAGVVAAAIGVPEVIAEVLPGQKAAAIADLQAAGHQVAMIGDGVNDGPALAQADLGLALMSGTDVARAAADLLLLRGDLDVVPAAIVLARAARRTIQTNLAWAFGYNVAALPLAAFGLLSPVIAAAAMACSSLFVVMNSLRLNREPRRDLRPGERPDQPPADSIVGSAGPLQRSSTLASRQ